MQAEWRAPLRHHVQRFPLKTGDAASVFRGSSRKADNLSEWREWQIAMLS